MTNNIKSAFDSIKAEESLKANTLIFIRKQTQKRSRPKRFVTVKRAAVAFASFVIVIMGVFSYNLYFTEVMFVDIDVNPSIGLSINRFERVIGTHAYNDDGSIILAAVNIRHRTYTDAIGVLIDAMLEKGYTGDDGLVSVTFQTQDRTRENTMLSVIETVVRTHHGMAAVEVFPVTPDARSAAHHLDLSPAMHLAILELQEVDPTITVDCCRHHSIGELRQRTAEHSSGHHRNSRQMENDNSDGDNKSENDARHSGDIESDNTNGTYNNRNRCGNQGHKGNRHGGGHH